MSLSFTSNDIDHNPCPESPVHLNFSGSYMLSTSSMRLSMLCSVDCFAMRLAQFLIDNIRMNIFPITKDDRFQESFYHHCMNAVEGTPLSGEINDCELMIIYIKRCPTSPLYDVRIGSC